MFTVLKRDKRLWIVCGELRTYTPPDFLRHKIKDRGVMQQLADAFNAAGEYDIAAVIRFETALR